MPNQYRQPLTAVGYGEPTFTAFYPNCFSVFGFQDGDPGKSIKGLTYEVIGWYSDAKQDALNKFITAHPNATLAELQEEFNWTTIADGEALPNQMLCYAQLTFQPNGSTANATTDASDTTITVGNTGTEALSAYLAQQIDSATNPLSKTSWKPSYSRPALKVRNSTSVRVSTKPVMRKGLPLLPPVRSGRSCQKPAALPPQTPPMHPLNLK